MKKACENCRRRRGGCMADCSRLKRKTADYWTPQAKAQKKDKSNAPAEARCKASPPAGCSAGGPA
jgi:hypothetical protein